MSPRRLKWPLVVLLTVSWSAVGFGVEPLDESWPADDVKSAARRILQEPEFRHFDHFPTDVQAIPVQPPTVAGDADKDDDAAGIGPAPWWKQAQRKQQQRERAQRPEPGENNGNGPSQPGPNQPGEGQPAQGAPGPGNPGDASKPADKPQPANDGVARPARINKTGPAVRGHDGIERPVRQALRKAPAPKPDAPSGPDTSMRLPNLGIGPALGAAFHGIAYLLLAAIIGVILYLIVVAAMSAWGERNPTIQSPANLVAGPLADDRSPGETAADEYLRAALALAQQGNYHAAVGKLLLGGMSFIERQQWIRYRRGLTSRDYLRVLRSRPEQSAGFRAVVQAFEPLEYGRRPATEDHYQAALNGYRRGFTPTTPEQEMSS